MTHPNPKYELLRGDFIETPKAFFFRIRALRELPGVPIGALGGFIQSERCLSHDGDAWVFPGRYRSDSDPVVTDAYLADQAARKYIMLRGAGNTLQASAGLLYRIKALRDLPGVPAGTLGGYIQAEGNLSHDGDSWIFEDARVSGSSRVCGNARVCAGASLSNSVRMSGNVMIESGSLTGSASIV